MKRMAHTNTTFFLKLSLIVGVRTNKGKKGKRCLQLWHRFNLQRQEFQLIMIPKNHTIFITCMSNPHFLYHIEVSLLRCTPIHQQLKIYISMKLQRNLCTNN